jgi:adenylosuccinate synthase
MPVTLVVGCQWGDEGKAKIIDYLARDADYVVRFQGGANAGHTVVVNGARFAFHLVPSGILYPHATCILAGGMVIDPLALAAELDMLAERGIDTRGRILVSEQAHVVFPYHVQMDRGTEALMGAASIGTTGRGITPAYVDKIGRQGVRMGDFLRSRAALERLITDKIRENNRRLRALGMSPIPVADTVESLLAVARRIAPLITDTRVVVWSGLDRKKRVLCEGAQGSLLDIDHGTYPFVTSSSSSAGGAISGAGIPPSSVERVIGIFKAYCTRVGNGPFPTEETGKIGDTLRDLGGEYGTTTGRPRRCGWFDGVAGRTTARLNGITEIALTKLDVLDSFRRIKVCGAYRCGKRRFDYMPATVNTLSRCKPEYEELDGWNESANRIENGELPPLAASYVAHLEKLVGCSIGLISLGPERRAVIDRTGSRRKKGTPVSL